MTGESAADTRMTRLEGLLGQPIQSSASRAAAVIVAIVATAVIAVMDYLTGVRWSLSVFYLVPVAATALAVSSGAALWLSVWAALAWSVADAMIEPARGSILVQLWNGGLRLGTLAAVVLLLSALRRALHQARASERRSKEFLAYAAHQLRTPVAGVRASAEALVLTTSTSQRDQLASNLTAESERMGRLVHSLLRLTRLDQGEPREQRPCDVEALLRAEMERLRVRAPDLELELRVAPGVPPSMVLDPTAVAEVAANLLDNARRHAARRIDVVVETSGTWLTITVVDDGAGLPIGGEERAFDRFVSLDGHGGSGLGLAIARSLAEAQGGELAYRSGRFVLRVPARPAAVEPAPAPAGEVRGAGSIVPGPS
ncbi:MAG TPA: HAMP domain-containing sensor histidine kinase [Acidimicrobiales bacterium]|nr:HAMP domain-containing sensor histidine kinase [Acidimicrobiales bacterium]